MPKSKTKYFQYEFKLAYAFDWFVCAIPKLRFINNGIVGCHAG